MLRRELTCREFIDFIADYWEEGLPAEQLGCFERHLAACPGCRAYLDGLRQSVSLEARALDSDGPLPDTVPEELVRAILDVRARK